MTASEWPGAPFRVETSEAVLTDLRERLERTRLPSEQAGPDWKTGTPISYAARLRDYWLQEFDWRSWEARINAFEQRMVELDGQRIHVIVERGSGERPLPLILSHGWPGSFMEFIDLVDRLAHPERHGGQVADAFTVVIPSLPGYGFSPPPAEPLSPAVIARLWSKLMVEAFGFDCYVAYGSDWGSLITARLALNHPERLAGFLITTPGSGPEFTANAPLTAEEDAFWREAQAKMAPESAYQAVQATKPQSLAYGHTDSPIALAAWVIEKFHGWTTPEASADPPFSMDVLLANVMLYWLNGSVAPMWLYMFLAESFTIPHGRKVQTPGGFLFAPDDISIPPPRSWLERMYENISYYRVAGHGGHFPSLDNADLLVTELRGFLHSLACGSRPGSSVSGS